MLKNGRWWKMIKTPSTFTTEENTEGVHAMILGNWWVAVGELAHHLHISHGFGHRIIHKQHVFHTICERRVPKQLTGDHNSKHLTICQWLHNEGDAFLRHIVTGDKSGSTITLQKANTRVCNENIWHYQWKKNPKLNHQWENCWHLLGRTRANFGILAREGQSSKYCPL